MRSIKVHSLVPVSLATLVMIAVAVFACNTYDECNPFYGGQDRLEWEGVLTTVGPAGPRFTPRWTASSDIIVFSSPSIYGGNIYGVAADGSDLWRISKSSGRYDEVDYSPEISPSGDRIVYTTSRHIGTGVPGTPVGDRKLPFEIETSDLRGKDRRRLTDNWHTDVSPVWTSDGGSVYFVSGPASGYYNRPRTGEPDGIYAIEDRDDDALTERLVVQFPSDDLPYYGLGRPGVSITMSPDGSNMLLEISDLAIVSTDGSDSRIVFESPFWTSGWQRVGSPAWSSDRRRLAVLLWKNPERADRSRGTQGSQFCRDDSTSGFYLCIFDLDGQDTQLIGLDAGRLWHSPYLSWSPDGKQILMTAFTKRVVSSNDWVWRPNRYFAKEADDQRHIASVDLASGETSIIAPGAYASWSPDGSRIAVIGRLDEDGSFMATMAPDGTDFRVLVKADDDGDLELADD